MPEVPSFGKERGPPGKGQSWGREKQNRVYVEQTIQYICIYIFFYTNSIHYIIYLGIGSVPLPEAAQHATRRVGAAEEDSASVPQNLSNSF